MDRVLSEPDRGRGLLSRDSETPEPGRRPNRMTRTRATSRCERQLANGPGHVDTQRHLDPQVSVATATDTCGLLGLRKRLATPWA